MKKIFLLPLLALVFTFFSTTTLDAQNLGNRTQCSIQFTVVFGTATCAVTGVTNVVVPPFSVVPVVPPPGSVIIAARTRYLPGLICPNTVSQFGCFGLPPVATNACPIACGTYTTAISAWGVVAHH